MLMKATMDAEWLKRGHGVQELYPRYIHAGSSKVWCVAHQLI